MTRALAVESCLRKHVVANRAAAIAISPIVHPTLSTLLAPHQSCTLQTLQKVAAQIACQSHILALACPPKCLCVPLTTVMLSL